MPRNLDDLLRATAVSPARDVDPADLITRGRRRRRRRQAMRASAGITAVAIGLIGVSLSLLRTPDVILESPSETPSLAVTAGPTNQPTIRPSATPTPEPTESQSDTSGLTRLDVEQLPDLPDEGIAVEQNGRLLLIGLDGKRHGYLEGELVDNPPGAQTATHVLAVATGNARWWVDPGNARYQDLTDDGIPLLGDHRIVRSTDDGSGYSLHVVSGGRLLASWPSEARWWLSPDHRTVTWESCPAAEGPCERKAYDTDMGGEMQLDRGCWVAATLGDFAFKQICRTGRRIEAFTPGGQPTEVDVPEGTDGMAAKAAAVFGDVVRVDHASCDVSEVRFIRGTELTTVLGDDPTRTPSAVPLGVAADGRIVVHFNSAPCDAGAEDPGVYLVNPNSGRRTLVWEGSAYRDDARMWAPTGVSLVNP